MAAGRVSSRRRRPSTRRSLVAAARKAFREDGGDGALSGRDRSLAENQGRGEGAAQGGPQLRHTFQRCGLANTSQCASNTGNGRPRGGPRHAVPCCAAWQRAHLIFFFSASMSSTSSSRLLLNSR